MILKTVFIPKGLIFEDDDSDKLRCIVVGINPGNADEKEREYVKRNPTYEVWIKYWNKRFKDKKYYRKRKNLLGNFLD